MLPDFLQPDKIGRYLPGVLFQCFLAGRLIKEAVDPNCLKQRISSVFCKASLTKMRIIPVRLRIHRTLPAGVGPGTRAKMYARRDFIRNVLKIRRVILRAHLHSIVQRNENSQKAPFLSRSEDLFDTRQFCAGIRKIRGPSA